MRARVARLMNDANSAGKRRFDAFIAFLILFSVGVIVYNSFTEVTGELQRRLLIINSVILSIFLVEYLARLWVIDPEYPHAVELTRGQRIWYALMARLRWAATPLALIDLIALLPLFPFDASLRMLRVVRMLRLLRLARLFAYYDPLKLLTSAFRANLLLYAVAFSFVVTTILIGSVSFYVAEFGSNPSIEGAWDALWWTVVTLTTVGYGDTVPVTQGGRFVAIGLMFTGMCLLALFAGVISQTLVGYLLEVREERVRMSTVVNQVVVCGWNSGGAMMVQEMARLDPDHEIVVLHRERPQDLPPAATFIKGQPSREPELEKVRLGLSRTVIVLASHVGDTEATDGHTALVVYTVRSYEAKLMERGVKRHTPIHVCAELMVPANYDHLKTAGADEVVHTTQIGSHLVAHSSSSPGLGGVFTELLSCWGQMVDIDSIPEDVELPATFLELAKRIREKGRYLIIGVIHKDRRMSLNPPHDLVIQPTDRIVYLREGGLPPGAI